MKTVFSALLALMLCATTLVADPPQVRTKIVYADEEFIIFTLVGLPEEKKGACCGFWFYQLPPLLRDDFLDTMFCDW